MNETEEKRTADALSLRSSVVALTVERGANGHTRVVLEGPCLDVTGFVPGDRLDAIVHSELITILPVE